MADVQVIPRTCTYEYLVSGYILCSPSHRRLIATAVAPASSAVVYQVGILGREYSYVVRVFLFLTFFEYFTRNLKSDILFLKIVIPGRCEYEGYGARNTYDVPILSQNITTAKV